MNSEKKRKTSDLLSICIKAGKTVKGFDSMKEAVIKGTAACVLTASDASDKTVKETEFICGKYNLPVLKTELTKSDIGRLFWQFATRALPAALKKLFLIDHSFLC